MGALGLRVALAGAVVAVVLVGWGASPAAAFGLPVPTSPGSITGAIAGDTAGALLDRVTKWVADGTTSLLGSLAATVDQQTPPDLEAGWFDGHYRTMAAIAVLLALPLLFGTAITAVVRQDAGPMLRAVLVHLPIAAIGTAVGIELVNLGLAATDELCRAVTAGTGHDTQDLVAGLAHAIGATGVASGFALFLVCLFVGLSALFLTLEMIVRSAAVYVAVLFLPLALTGLVWPATAKWGKRLAELLAVLIVSKFVVVAIISMAIPAVAAGSTASGLGGLLSGAALLFLAGVAPFTLLRMVPVIEAGVVGHLEGAGRRPLAAVPLSSRDVVQHVIQQQQRQQEQHSAPDPAPGPLSGRPSAERFGDVDSRMEQAADGTLGGPGRPVPAGGLIGGVGPSGSAAVGEAGSAAGGGAAGGAGAGGAAAAGLATAGVGAAAAATTSAARSARSALADPAGELAQLGGGDE